MWSDLGHNPYNPFIVEKFHCVNVVTGAQPADLPDWLANITEKLEPTDAAIMVVVNLH